MTFAKILNINVYLILGVEFGYYDTEIIVTNQTPLRQNIESFQKHATQK
jgi:hypothetical protein